jgi:hypothetical protein
MNLYLEAITLSLETSIRGYNYSVNDHVHESKEGVVERSLNTRYDDVID